MEGEMTGDIRIVCFEERKVRRVSLVLSTWSETLDEITLRIEDRDLRNDEAVGTDVIVPMDALMRALKAIERLNVDE